MFLLDFWSGECLAPWWLAIVEDRIDAAAHARAGLFRLPNGRFGLGSVKMITFLGTPIWHPSLLLTWRGGWNV